jgi:hypothetical protein
MKDGTAGGKTENIAEQFDQLIDELLRKDLRRVSFRPWEIAVLVDIATCDVRVSVLREYRIAVLNQLRNGVPLPMKLSEYLAQRNRRHKQADRRSKKSLAASGNDT